MTFTNKKNKLVFLVFNPRFERRTFPCPLQDVTGKIRFKRDDS